MSLYSGREVFPQDETWGRLICQVKKLDFLRLKEWHSIGTSKLSYYFLMLIEYCQAYT